MTGDTVTYGTDLQVTRVGGVRVYRDRQLNCGDGGKAGVREVAVINAAAV